MQRLTDSLPPTEPDLREDTRQDTADRREPEPVISLSRSAPDDPQPIPTYLADMLTTHGQQSVTARSAGPSTWFTEQPEFQRLRERERRLDRESPIIPRWLLILAAALITIMAAVAFGPGFLTSFTDSADGSSVLSDAEGTSEEPALDIEPTVTDQTPDSEPDKAPPVADLRAPTATGEPAPTPSVGQVTIMVKRPPDAVSPDDDREVAFAEPTNDVPPSPPAPASEAPQSPNGGGTRDRESVFAPSRPASQPVQPSPKPAATPAEDQPPADPFATFSSDSPRPPAPAAPAVSAVPAVPAEDATAPAEQQGPEGAQQPDTAFEPSPPPAPADQYAVAAVMDRAKALFRDRDLKGAEAALLEVIAADPQNIDALATYGDVLILDRRLTDALDVLNRILALKPDDGRALVNRGTTLIALGRPAEAKRDAEAALAIESNNALAVGLRSKATAALGDMSEAMSDCGRIGGLNATKSAVTWCRAAVQKHAGNQFVAVQMFIAALGAGEQSFVRAKQIYLKDLKLYDGPIDGIANWELADAVTACANAVDCIL